MDQDATGMELMRATMQASGQERAGRREVAPPAPTDQALRQIFQRVAQDEGKAAALAQANQERRQQALIDQVKQDLGRRYWPDEVGLDRYKVYATEQKAVLDRLRGLAGQLPELIRQGVGLMFYGSVGTGKEYLVASLLYAAAAAGFPCRWRRGLDLYGQLRDRMKDDAKEEEYLRSLTAPTVLAIADPIPPVGVLSDFRTEFLLRLVDRRYNARLPTWITLNVADLAEADKLLSSPVFDRLQQDADLFPCFWQSWRERSRERRAS